ncbi:hypothetical protein [Micromonospora sp. KLBMP9576]|uniref:hypothetical protein n=1 Tax=Micromonospora sp. KLBMP9576 TaxID=3424769 RepID=UPI003D8F7D17
MSTTTIDATAAPPADSEPDPAADDPASPGDLPETDADELPAESPGDDSDPDSEADGPAGFPGGAILISVGDVLAVGSGAVLAGAGGLGALLLAAAATAAAGLALTERKNKRKRDAAAGRTGQTARPSRRAAAAGGIPGGGGRGRGKPGSGKGTPGGVFGRSKPGGKNGGAGKPSAGGGPFGRSKPSKGKGSAGTPGGLFGKGKPGGSKGSPGGLFDRGKPAGSKGTPGGRSKPAGKGMKPHLISDPGLRPRTGATPRGKTSGPKASPKAIAGPDEAARKAEEARKANETKPTTDETNKATTDKNGNDSGPADVAGLLALISGGAQMGQFPLPGAASEFRSAASRYTPDDMYEFGAHLAQMPAAMLDIAEGLKAMALRTHAERPVDPRVVEALAALYQVQRATIAAAETIAPVFRKVHERDLARREAPRTNEQEWNV